MVPPWCILNGGTVPPRQTQYIHFQKKKLFIRANESVDLVDCKYGTISKSISKKIVLMGGNGACSVNMNQRLKTSVDHVDFWCAPKKGKYMCEIFDVDHVDKWCVQC